MRQPPEEALQGDEPAIQEEEEEVQEEHAEAEAQHEEAEEEQRREEPGDLEAQTEVRVFSSVPSNDNKDCQRSL